MLRGALRRINIIISQQLTTCCWKSIWKVDILVLLILVHPISTTILSNLLRESIMIENIIFLQQIKKLLWSILITTISEFITNDMKNIWVVLLNMSNLKLRKENLLLALTIDPTSFSRNRRRNLSISQGLRNLMISGCISNPIVRRNNFILKLKGDKRGEIKLTVYIVIWKSNKDKKTSNIYF